jgi:hypothetical protein
LICAFEEIIFATLEKFSVKLYKLPENKTMFLRRQIDIAGLTINTYIDSRFKSIDNFLKQFASPIPQKRNKLPSIYIFKKECREIRLSRNWKILSITGDKIDDLQNPFNLIGLIQAIFRFSAIHLASRNIFLLHGSAAVFNGQIVLFGDDGKSTAKTLGSLYVALRSKEYVADEFCFFDAEKGTIFGHTTIPIHIRPIVAKNLDSQNLEIPKSSCWEAGAGFFVKPQDLFQVTSGSLKALLYIHFSEKKIGIEQLSLKEAQRSFNFCAASHIAKLIYPELDHMQFISKIDKSSPRHINVNLINSITKKVYERKLDLDFLNGIASYRITISSPDQIAALLKSKLE